MDLLERKGSGFVTRDRFNLFASTDEWTAPIAAEVGPDGAVWVIDWYNYIVQHNPTPLGFKTGKGNAYETPLRDKTHGRIYRVINETVAPGQDATTWLRTSPDGLLAALRSDNMFWRLQAEWKIVERGKKDVVPALVALVNDRKTDEIGEAPGACTPSGPARPGRLDGSERRGLDRAGARPCDTRPPGSGEGRSRPCRATPTRAADPGGRPAPDESPAVRRRRCWPWARCRLGRRPDKAIAAMLKDDPRTGTPVDHRWRRPVPPPATPTASSPPRPGAWPTPPRRGA